MSSRPIGKSNNSFKCLFENLNKLQFVLIEFAFCFSFAFHSTEVCNEQNF
ncbi:hypothetical protein RchiOBHm_Chr7g0188411 [Rosa chinensis]|uniref:Uncharacterized protein n=1 Tax=Rosa chinensis TaxID=74649 RepID=A0A2P6P4G7_ROSCH|nr:hypothetical protein RchiOBHm_Chr7g0188411 [Rosa chinensis]